MTKTLFPVFLFAFHFCHGQTTFQKTYGGTNDDRGNWAEATSDGGFIIAGYETGIGAGNRDVYLLKTDAYGDSIWTKTYGGIDDDEANVVKQTMDGGYIAGGFTYSTAGGDRDIYLIKTNSNGDTLWTRTYGNIGSDDLFSVELTADSGYIVAGETDSYGSNLDIYIIRINSYGDTLWTKTYNGNNHEGGYCIKQTSDAGFIICGTTMSFGAGDWDACLIKTDGNGDTLWAKSYGGILMDQGYDVIQTSDGGYIMTGQTLSFGSGNLDTYLVKTDDNGNLLWSKAYGGTGNDWGVCIKEAAGGGYVIAGRSFSNGHGSSDVYMMGTDENGVLLWSKAYGGTGYDYGSSLCQAPGGGFMIAASGTSFGMGNYDVYLIKTDSLGNSGCNEIIHPTVTTNALTQVSSGAMAATAPPTLLSHIPTGINGGGSKTIQCLTMDVPPHSKDIQPSYFIYPNPFSDDLKIRSSSSGAIIAIYNYTGKEILRTTSNTEETVLNTEGIAAGFYLLRVESGDGVANYKVVKQ